MLRCFLSQFLCVLMALTVPTSAQGESSNQDKQPTLQEKLVLIPAGSVIEVKTKAKTKIVGKLGPLASDSFEVQVAKGGTIEKQSIRFEDVKSVKIKGAHPGRNTTLWIALTVGICAAGFVIVVALVYWTHG